MKLADIGGFAAILFAGYEIGKDKAFGSFPATDVVLIAAAIALGFYLAVVLS